MTEKLHVQMCHGAVESETRGPQQTFFPIRKSPRQSTGPRDARGDVRCVWAREPHDALGRERPPLPFQFHYKGDIDSINISGTPALPGTLP